MKKSIVPFLLVVLSLISITLGCRKDSGSVPLVGVDITININNPSFIDIKTVGGWVYITGGSQGIIVYRRSIDEFVALDRHCTYLPQENCRVSVDSTQIQLEDTQCCESKFSLIDGTVINPPASLPLTSYQTDLVGNTLRIYN